MTEVRAVLDGIQIQTALALGVVAFPETPEERDSADRQITEAMARLTRAIEDVLAECDHTDVDSNEALQWDLVNRIQTAIEAALTKATQ